MSVVARLEVIPTRQGNMSAAVARALEALDGFDVSYETTPTDTVIEADDPDEVFAAAAAAHRAAATDRVITSLELDDDRTRTQRGSDRVASVERHLGRPARRERGGRTSPPQSMPQQGGNQLESIPPESAGESAGGRTPAADGPARYVQSRNPAMR